MVVLVQANILTIGLGDKSEVLQELPIRVMSLDSALNAAAFLRNDNFDGVISNWDVQEMENKIFIKKLRAAKPNMPSSSLRLIRLKNRTSPAPSAVTPHVKHVPKKA